MISRILPLCRRPVLQQLSRNILKGNVAVTVRASGHAAAYRAAPHPPPKSVFVLAEVVGGLMWWWILWHLWHESDHITGEFPYPNTKEWTNKELGIPHE